MLQKFSDSLNVLGSARGGWTAGSRNIFRCLPSLMKNAYAIPTHMNTITLHYRALVVVSFMFQWHFSQASHRI